MNIHVPSVPGRLVLTEGMLTDFLLNPVLAARIAFPDLELDAFQRARLKLEWIVPVFEDCSGVSTAKTLVADWVFANLRALLIVNGSNGQHVGVYFPNFQSGKESFWEYYSKEWCSSAFFRAQLGQKAVEESTEAESRKKQPSVYVQHFKNGSTVKMPAPSAARDAATQKSLRFNTLIVEEVSEWDVLGDGVDKELIPRCSAESWNPAHPVWGNHFKFLYHAEAQQHPSYKRHHEVANEVRKGNPNYGTAAWSYKDYSKRKRKDGSTFDRLRESAEKSMHLTSRVLSDADRLSTHFGLWAKQGVGWFTQDLLDAATARGVKSGAIPALNRRHLEQELERILKEAWDAGVR
jgi:hypothetical protein